MRDINRIDKVLTAIGETWKKLPDWRLTQLIDNFYSAMGSDCFYMEDADFAAKLAEWVDKMIYKDRDILGL